MNNKHSFADIEGTKLTHVTGGAARTSSSGTDAKLQLMLSSITDSIKDVANSKSSSTDQMMPMMMMMMMMGGGGGGAAAPAAPPPPPSGGTFVRVNVRR